MVDAVVVGGGLGGLAAAIGLLRAGRTVRVLEAGDVVGGYAANFVRGDYRFDASLHLLDAVEPGGSNRGIWSYLGLDKRVSTVVPDVMRRERWPEHDLVIPQGMRAWIDALAAAFPGERAGLEGVARLAGEVHAQFVADRDARLAGDAPPPLADPMAALMDATAATALRRFLRDERLVAVAGSLSCYLGLGCADLAAIPYLTMLATYHAHAGSYPRGGSGAIAAALADEVVALGGTIHLGARVTAIGTAWGRVANVTLADGDLVETPVVVVNGSPRRTAEELLPAGVVERRALRRLQAAPLGTSVVKVWLGLRQDLDPEAFPYETFLRGSYGVGTEDGGLDDVGVVAPHRADPGCCPPGGAVIAVTIGAEADLSADAEARNAQLAHEAVRRVEARMHPGLGGAADVRVVATPRTFFRYTSNPGGAIHGFRPVPSQSGPRRPGVGGLVGGLWHVGGWTYAGSGFTPSMTTGLCAAAAITGRLA